MSDSIRKQMFDAVETKIAGALKVNGYATDCGKHPYQGAVTGLELPFINFAPGEEAAVPEPEYGRDVRTVRVIFEAGMEYVPGESAGELVEKMLADMIEVVSGSKWTVAFTSGGKYVIKPGHTITGADSSAIAMVESVALSTGAWASGTAAGTLTLRRKSGVFAAENLNIGTNTNVCTINGSLTRLTPEVTTADNKVDDILYVGGGARSYPEAGDNVAGCYAEFDFLFHTSIGDPYNQ